MLVHYANLSHSLSASLSLATVIYLNLRVAKEDLTREILTRELGLEPQLEVPTAAAVGRQYTTKGGITNQDNDII